MKIPESWLAMIRQLISYNLMRYVLMAGICYALFFSTGWKQAVGGVVLALLLLVKYTDAVFFSETERIVSRWANGYFFAGSLALAGGLSHHQPILICTGALLHCLYWYACLLGYSNSLTFSFDGANENNSSEPTSP